MNWNRIVFAGFFAVLSMVAIVPERSFATAVAPQKIAVNAKTCEDIRKGEPKSSTRVRVTDKASFMAVEKIKELQDFRRDATPHDFNVMVYHLVDNYLEDLSAKTLSEDGQKLCVEIHAVLSADNVEQVLQNTMENILRRIEAEEDDLTTPIEKPKESLYPKITPPNPAEVLKEENSENTAQTVYLYFEPTQFYNNTASSKFTDILKQQFSQNANWRITLQKEKANFVIKSKVLRAKVDPINSSTQRLQMVVALELENSKQENILTEHQNRFVLFTAEENEQEVAFKLLRKLFETAGNLLIKKIDREVKKGLPPLDENAALFPEIITPNR